MDWAKRRVLVSGGASFIGSYLVEATLVRGAAGCGNSCRDRHDRPGLSQGGSLRSVGNRGTDTQRERIRAIDAVGEVLRCTGHSARIETRPEMPTGPMNRVAHNSLAKQCLGWEPAVRFVYGLHRTMDWYFERKNPREVQATLGRMLTDR